MMNAMLDTETLGLRPEYAILSIGAVGFELNGTLGEIFYANIDPKSCVDAGLKRNSETMTWWSRQSTEAQNRLIIDRRPLKDVLADFIAWWIAGRYSEVWCQGAAFDVPIVEAAMDAVGLTIPWKFWSVRDTRTAYALAGLDPRDVPRVGTAHDALDDARHQVACVAAAVRKLQPSKRAFEDLF